MDVCVITYRNTLDRVQPGLRPHDRLWVRDNTSHNIGFARAANELASRGSEPLILLINPDGDPQPGCLDLLEGCFDRRDVVAASASQGPSWQAWEKKVLDGWLPATCLAVRREAFEAVRGFDEQLFMYGEDIDLTWRLARFGRLVLCHDAVFLHDFGARSWLANYRIERNTLLVRHRWNRKYFPWFALRAGMETIGRGSLRSGSALAAAAAISLVADRRRPVETDAQR
jgi:GT2 family glycosyltransferase